MKIMKKKCSHEENLAKVCLLCLKKCKNMRVITESIKEHLLVKLDRKDLPFEDNHLPRVLCEYCRRKLYQFDAEACKVKNTDTIKPPDYVLTIIDSKTLRSNNNFKTADDCCNCEICKIATAPANKNLLTGNIRKNELEEKSKSKKKTTLKQVSRGERVSNTAKYIAVNFTSTEKEMIMSELVKNNIAEQNLNPNEKNIKLSLKQAKGGKNLGIVVKPTVSNETKVIQIPAEGVKQIKTAFNLSNNAMTGIVSAFRKITRNQHLFEPGIKEKLVADNHILDDYFNFKEINTVVKKKNIVTESPKIAIYCNDIEKLIEKVMDHREVSEATLKLGIDSGGKFLKICLSIQSEDSPVSDQEPPKKRLFNGDFEKEFKDSSVKRLFLIGLVQRAQENYDCLKELWNLLKLNNLQAFLAIDLKVANMLIGLSTHSSSYPCTWCEAPLQNLSKQGRLRTIAGIRENYVEWKKSGSQKENAKLFKSCIENLLLNNCQNDTEILNIIPPPELHLLLGVVNKMYTEMSKEFPTISEKFAELCFVKHEIKKNGSAFKGNSCKTLLNNVDKLRLLCNTEILCLKYLDAFQKFRTVVDSCFGQKLEPDYMEKIKFFESSYKDLKISITSKVHAVFVHVPEFCKRKQRGLGFYSEQAMEAVHFDFAKTWANYKTDERKQNYAEKLLRSVCDYNSNHL